MTALYRIARTELARMFYSPIAWLMLIVFILQTSMGYAAQLGRMAGQAFMGSIAGLKVTTAIFSDGNFGLFVDVIGNLYLYVPLLSMGLIARELQSGSIKLLLSSPVNLWQIILGKFLAMAVYFMGFVVFLLGLMLMTGAMVENLDMPLVLSGLLGIYLLALTYTAVGLFMSSLTAHQVVAAISTLAVLFGLNFVGSLGQRIPLVSDLAYWLSMAGRVDYLRDGLIASKDVLYFLSVMAMLLTFTWLKLSAGRKPESGLTIAGKYVAVLLIATVFGALSSHPALTVYLDTTREKSQTLSPASQAIMNEIEGPWKITVYANILNGGLRFQPRSQNALERRLFDQYLRANPGLEVEYVLYYGPSNIESLYERYPGKSDEDIARALARQYRIDFDDVVSTEEASTLAGVSTEAEGHRNFYVIEWNGRAEVFRNFDDLRYLPGEREISAALKRIAAGPVRIAYVTGHGERSAYRRGDEDHQLVASSRNFRPGLRNHGFDVEETSLDRPLPEDVDLLVIAAPQQPYSPEALDILGAYIDRGGNLLIAGEPAAHDVLNPIVRDLGVAFTDGRIVEPKQDFPEDLIFARLARNAADYGFEVGGRAADRPYFLNGAGILNYANDGPWEAIPILVADGERAFLRTETLVPFDETALGLAMRRTANGTEQRLMIMTDADFMSTLEMARTTVQTNNFEFVLDMFGWLSNGEYPIDASRPIHIDDDIDLAIEDVTWIKWLLYGVLSGSVLLLGASLLIRRRRQ